MLVKTPLKEKQNKQARPNKRPEAKQGRNRPKSPNGFNSTGNGRVVYGTQRKEEKKKFSLPSVAAWKLIVGAIVIGALGVLYLNHIFATQQLLAEVQQLENQYQKAKRQHEDYRLTYDRMIGPKEIYEKAKNQGFINGGPADQVIIVEGD
ncbi:hypothetical protein NC796_22195 [Aliifodinibius sp. S!AR15-10]|uniref:hypothetical protein n=1 Tax=Aliifodinibius sp. S!AR15-10 TaxID=2950437 RepID=UPI00285F4062|nr:hypothetical protein [Aliifodinibius sp. S!AR15-10]MDR8393881.1 hypothetical protein [Aliifodinibius sp. S!AR15-10]